MERKVHTAHYLLFKNEQGSVLLLGNNSIIFYVDIDTHYQYDSCVKYIYIKGDVILIMIRKKYMNAIRYIAATLAVPLAVMHGTDCESRSGSRMKQLASISRWYV